MPDNDRKSERRSFQREIVEGTAFFVISQTLFLDEQKIFVRLRFFVWTDKTASDIYRNFIQASKIMKLHPNLSQIFNSRDYHFFESGFILLIFPFMLLKTFIENLIYFYRNFFF